MTGFRARATLIAAVGADVTAPADARVLGPSGRDIAPGIIDLTSRIGRSTAPTPGGRGGQGAAAAQSANAIPMGFDGMSGPYPAKQLGSIEVGKATGLQLTTDPLDVRTVVEEVFVRGVPTGMRNRHTELYEKFRARPSNR